MLLSFKTRLPFDKLPEWRELRALPLDEQAELLRDPELRERLVRAANEGDYGRAVGAEARKPDYDRIHVLERPDAAATRRWPSWPSRAGRDPVEIMIDLALEIELRAVLRPAVPANRDPERSAGDHEAPAHG